MAERPIQNWSCLYCSGKFERKIRPRKCPHCGAIFSITLSPKTTMKQLVRATDKNKMEVQISIASLPEEELPK